jgi:hypoxanthine phosphoribosyltransferase
MTDENFLIDYSVFCELCYDLLDILKKRGKKYDGILCPLRGGFYLSNFMSRHLDLSIEYIVISSYTGKNQHEFSIPYRADIPGGCYLLCDDVYDSGRTIEKIYSLYPHVEFETVCVASKVEKAGLIYGCLVDKKRWIDFFWELM